jgi:hypothetical protein
MCWSSSHIDNNNKNNNDFPQSLHRNVEMVLQLVLASHLPGLSKSSTYHPTIQPSVNNSYCPIQTNKQRSFVYGYKSFKGTYCLHLQGGRWSQYVPPEGSVANQISLKNRSCTTNIQALRGTRIHAPIMWVPTDYCTALQNFRFRLMCDITFSTNRNCWILHYWGALLQFIGIQGS